MANIADIRRRIKSVKNTSQITRAMQLVAASKMKKAQDQAVAGRPYAVLLNRVITNLKRNDTEMSHPLLEGGGVEGDKELVIVVNTDKGLCGGLNTNLLRATLDGAAGDADFVTVGKKLRGTLARMNKNLVADFPIADPAHFSEAKRVATFATEQFMEGGYATVKIAFTNFVNTLRQEPAIETLLPVSPVELGGVKDFGHAEGEEDEEEAADASLSGGYLFEPSGGAVLDVAVPMYVNYEVYQMILEARASEHSARMVAMKSATDNAEQMVKDLTLEYNKVRQAAITAELLEISTAMKALE